MNFLKLIISIAVCALAGYIGSIFTAPVIPTWYAALNKPPFNPPNWIFGPVWATLYLLMAVAAYIIWEKGAERKEIKTALGFFIAQLILNSLWSILFFGMKSPVYGLICIVILWLAILLTIMKFYKISKTAGWLLIPYILWVSFASILNLAIAILN